MTNQKQTETSRPATRTLPCRFNPESADHYEWVHGRRPSGRGSWAFTFIRWNGQSAPWFAPAGLTYTEAKRAAIKHGREIRATSCSVCS